MLFLPLLILYLGLMSRIFCLVPYRGFILAFFYDIAAGALFAGIAMLFRKKINRRITLITGYVLTVWYIAMSIIQSSYQTYMSVSTIFKGAKGVAGGFASNVISAIAGGIPRIILMAAPIVIYQILSKKHLKFPRFKPAAAAIVVAFSLILFGGCVLVSQIGSLKSAYKTDYSFDFAVRTFGVLTGTRLDLKYMIFGNNSKSFAVEEETGSDPAEEETTQEVVKVYGKNEMDIDFNELAASSDNAVSEIAEYVSSQKGSAQNEYTGLFKGKNLILICAEAFSDAVVREDLTPTLYRMVHKGFYFSDFYQPAWGGSTSTGEFSFVMGLAPQNGTETMQDIKDNNNYFTLGNQLQRENYYNMAFHNGDYDYYDRQLTHTSLGYATWYGIGNGLEDITAAWGGDDRNMSDALEYFIDKQPFSIYFMTVSGHASYTEDSDYVYKYYDRVDAVLGDSCSEKVKYYFCHQMEVEDMMTHLIERLEEAGIAEDTVIVMTGDHYPYGLTNSAAWGNDRDYLAELYGGSASLDWDRDHNSLILWSECLEKGDKSYACEISSPTFSLDVTPTLSNLFGVEYDSRLLTGRDVFSDQEAIVFWNSGSWMTDHGRFDAESNKFYPNEGYENDQSYVSRIANIVSNRLYLSRMIINNDFYGTLFGPDNDTGRPIYLEK